MLGQLPPARQHTAVVLGHKGGGIPPEAIDTLIGAVELRDEHPPVRQERQVPRDLQVAAEDVDTRRARSTYRAQRP